MDDGAEAWYGGARGRDIIGAEAWYGGARGRDIIGAEAWYGGARAAGPREGEGCPAARLSRANIRGGANARKCRGMQRGGEWGMILRHIERDGDTGEGEMDRRGTGEGWGRCGDHMHACGGHTHT